MAKKKLGASLRTATGPAEAKADKTATVVGPRTPAEAKLLEELLKEGASKNEIAVFLKRLLGPPVGAAESFRRNANPFHRVTDKIFGKPGERKKDAD